MPNSNDRPSGSHNSVQKPRTSGGIRFFGRPLRDIEREAVERTLELNGNNQSATAKILGISRPTLARKLQAYRAADSAGRSKDDAAD
jgi:DNA-binding NtrC family response regulator